MKEPSKSPPPLVTECPDVPIDWRRVQRQHDFALLCEIQDKTKRPQETPSQLEGPALDQLRVVLGAPLDVDDESPIDLEPRYFVVGDGSLADDLRAKAMQQIEPIDVARLHKRQWSGCQELARRSLADARRIARCCESTAWRASRWSTHRYVSERGRPEAAQVSRAAGSTSFHYFAAGSYRMWPRGPGWRDWLYDPDVPHAMGTVYDMAAPREAAVLRSELLFATSLLKASVLDSDMFLEHKTCPILVVSFHARFSARVLQVHLESGHMVVRASRLLDLHAGHGSQDFARVVRWLDCRPMGDTRWECADSTWQQDEPVAASSEKREPPRHAMAIVQPA
ncbi:hypothetical protein HIM_04030 [Hirsutella minnesotensis 3608]|uniref:Uncharacterized protein n=1 Tax=Hirsutella minnesotensis 3608 TaxID=1043627 RepID=A0A0F8A696_9HYPO|nr:hypothetical protein HIM_04030 [Hirsutella minnesotensis 3608]